jgi:Tfp pilus assembly PilM family ATPase
MARLLAMEWDHQQLRMVEAASRSGQVEVRRARAWSESVSPNPVQADEAGQRLRERLKEAGIAPGPAVFVVGRDRLLFREIRYPDVPAAEAAAVIHFQAAKELNFPADEAVVDYAPNSVPGPLGEKRALAVMIRRELLDAIQKACKTAGLKLEGVAARPFALVAAWLAQQPANAEPNGVDGLLVLNGSSAEFCVSRGKELLFSRWLTWESDSPSPGELVPELKRTLAAYATQFPTHALGALHVAGLPASEAREALAAGLRLPVKTWDPLAGLSVPELSPSEQSGLAGVLGAARAGLAGRKLPVDFLKPKEAHPKDTRKQRYLIAAAAGLLLLVGLVGGLYAFAVSWRNSRIEELQIENTRLVKQAGEFGDVEQRLEEINKWAGSEMVVLDEFYDLVAHFPHQPGVRITKASWTPLNEPGRSLQPIKPGAAAKPAATKPAVEKPIGQLVIEATATGDPSGLERLRTALQAGRQWKLYNWETPAANQAKATLHVYRQRPSDYQATLMGYAPSSPAFPRERLDGPGGKPGRPGGRP